MSKRKRSSKKAGAGSVGGCRRLAARLPVAIASVILAASLMLSPASAGLPVEDDLWQDPRAWMHGLDIVLLGSRHMVVFSSNGYPPSEPGMNWSHDIYYSWLDVEQPELDPRILVRYNEAQEPASAAVSPANGRLLVTCEDGNDNYYQNAALFEPDLGVVKEYPWVVGTGGHSGHVDSLVDRGDFLVVYGEGWVEGGGACDYGTGDDVYARIVHDDGTMEDEEIPTSVGPEQRDGWPLVAGSDRNWLEVWQRYHGEGHGWSLHGAVIGESGSIDKRFQISGEVDYCNYDVEYLPESNRYLVLGRRGDHGFLSIYDSGGSRVSEIIGLPPIVREAELICRDDRGVVTVAYPASPSGLAVLRIAGDQLSSSDILPCGYRWVGVGSDGLFVDKNTVLYAAMSKKGMSFLRFDIAVSGRPDASGRPDRCAHENGFYGCHEVTGGAATD